MLLMVHTPACHQLQAQTPIPPPCLPSRLTTRPPCCTHNCNWLLLVLHFLVFTFSRFLSASICALKMSP